MASHNLRTNTRLKRGDLVKVITGNSEIRGKTGRITKVDLKRGRVIVEGLNMVKRHQRPTAGSQTGRIVEKEAPIALSNVMLVVDGTPTRIRIETTEEGPRRRVAVKTGKPID